MQEPWCLVSSRHALKGVEITVASGRRCTVSSNMLTVAYAMMEWTRRLHTMPLPIHRREFFPQVLHRWGDNRDKVRFT
jgi:hypothetical protein